MRGASPKRKRRLPTAPSRPIEAVVGQVSPKSTQLVSNQAWIVRQKLYLPRTGQVINLNFRTRLFLTFEDSNTSKLSKAIAVLIMALIIISCFSFVISTVDDFRFQPPTCASPACLPTDPGAICTKEICEPVPFDVFAQLEYATIIAFSVEYLIRVLTVYGVPLKVLDAEGYAIGKYPKNISFLYKTYRYITTALNLIDLAAILPFYIALATNTVGLGFLRILRLARVLRIFKLGKYSEGSTLFANTMRSSMPALTLLMFFMIIMMILFGSLIYFFEQGTFQATTDFPDGAYFRPDLDGMSTQISPFSSIPLAFYWVIVTTTTVGFGDFYPTTALGRFTAALAAYVGILCIALPTTIVGTNFTNEYNSIYHPELLMLPPPPPSSTSDLSTPSASSSQQQQQQQWSSSSNSKKVGGGSFSFSSSSSSSCSCSSSSCSSSASSSLSHLSVVPLQQVEEEEIVSPRENPMIKEAAADKGNIRLPREMIEVATNKGNLGSIEEVGEEDVVHEEEEEGEHEGAAAGEEQGRITRRRRRRRGTRKVDKEVEERRRLRVARLKENLQRLDLCLMSVREELHGMVVEYTCGQAERVIEGLTVDSSVVR